MSEEKRKFRRFECLLVAEVNLEGNANLVRKATVKDFSREGLRLVLHNFNINPGSSVDLKLYFPGKNLSISVSGEIAWSKYINNNWEVGVKTNQMDKEAKSEILDYVYTMWRERMRGEKEK